MFNLNVFALQNAIANLNQQYEKFESESEALTSRKKKLDKEVRRGNENVRTGFVNNDLVLRIPLDLKHFSLQWSNISSTVTSWRPY